MEEHPVTLIGEITDFEIHLVDDASLVSTLGASALSASMEIKIDEDYYVFGGPSLFLSVPNQEGSDFVGHFIVRCFQAVGVHTTREMEGALIKVKLADGKIMGISSLENDNFFFPSAEFQDLEEGEVTIDD